MQFRSLPANNSLLNRYLDINNQSAVTANRLNHEAIALYLRHTLREIKEQTFALAGSEDLRALLPRLKLQDEGDEAFILIRPYIHSMAMYCRYENRSLNVYIFDSQDWGKRYYPTRLIIDAIKQHFPESNIVLSNSELQFKDASGCVAYAITFLEYCRDHGADIFTKFTRQLPSELLKTAMAVDCHWAESVNDAICDKAQEMLIKYITSTGAFDHERIYSVIRVMQGIDLPYTHIVSHDSMYQMSVSESGKELIIQFNNKDAFLYNNILIYSIEEYPGNVALQSSRKLLDDVDGVSVICNPELYTLTYSAKSAGILLAAFNDLQWRSHTLFNAHVRQSGALAEIISEVNLHVQMQNIMKNHTGGMCQDQVQLALSALFQQHQDVYIPSIAAIAGMDARLPISALQKAKYKYVGFTYQCGSHQIGVMVELAHENIQVSLLDSELNGLNSELTIALARMIGVDPSKIIVAPVAYVQRDDWSCGVHVIANLLRYYQEKFGLTCADSLHLEESLLHYLRAARYQQALDSRQESEFLYNAEQLSRLLHFIEAIRFKQGFYQNIHHELGDELKYIADYLQHLKWGNQDRKSSPNDQLGRANQSDVIHHHSLSEILDNLKRQCPAGATQSILLLQLCIILLDLKNDNDEHTLIDSALRLFYGAEQELLSCDYSQSNQYSVVTNTLLYLKQESYMSRRDSSDAKGYLENAIITLLTTTDSESLPLALARICIVAGASDETAAYEEAIALCLSNMPLESIYTVALDMLKTFMSDYISFEKDTKAESNRLIMESRYLAQQKQDHKHKLDNFDVWLDKMGILLPLEVTQSKSVMMQLLNREAFLKKYLSRSYFKAVNKQYLIAFFKKVSLVDKLDVIILVELCPKNNKNIYLSYLRSLGAFERNVLSYDFEIMPEDEFLACLQKISAESDDVDLVDNVNYMLQHPDNLTSSVFEREMMFLSPCVLRYLFSPYVLSQIQNNAITSTQVTNLTDRQIQILLSRGIMLLLQHDFINLSDAISGSYDHGFYRDDIHYRLAKILEDDILPPSYIKLIGKQMSDRSDTDRLLAALIDYANELRVRLSYSGHVITFDEIDEKIVLRLDDIRRYMLPEYFIGCTKQDAVRIFNELARSTRPAFELLLEIFAGDNSDAYIEAVCKRSNFQDIDSVRDIHYHTSLDQFIRIVLPHIVTSRLPHYQNASLLLTEEATAAFRAEILVREDVFDSNEYVDYLLALVGVPLPQYSHLSASLPHFEAPMLKALASYNIYELVNKRPTFFDEIVGLTLIELKRVISSLKLVNQYMFDISITKHFDPKPLIAMLQLCGFDRTAIAFLLSLIPAPYINFILTTNMFGDFRALRYFIHQCHKARDHLSMLAGRTIDWPVEPRVIVRHFMCINLFITADYFAGVDNDPVMRFLAMLERKCNLERGHAHEMKLTSHSHMLEMVIDFFPGSEESKRRYLDNLYKNIDIKNNALLKQLLEALVFHADTQNYRLLLGRLLEDAASDIGLCANLVLRALDVYTNADQYFHKQIIFMSPAFVSFIFTPHIFQGLQKAAISSSNLTNISCNTMTELLSESGQQFVTRNPILLKYVSKTSGVAIQLLLSEHAEIIIREKLAPLDKLCETSYGELHDIISAKGVLLLRTGMLNLEMPYQQRSEVLRSDTLLVQAQRINRLNRSTLFGNAASASASTPCIPVEPISAAQPAAFSPK